MLLAAWVRAKQALSVAFSILEVKSFKVSSLDSLNGSMPSQGCCTVLIIKGEDCVEVWTWSLLLKMQDSVQILIPLIFYSSQFILLIFHSCMNLQSASVCCDCCDVVTV